MVHRATILAAAAAVCVFCVFPQAASAQVPGPNGLEYSYLCPRPVPPLVGYTYITYPPLAPHQFLGSCHSQSYDTYNCDCTVTHTTIHYNHRCCGCCGPSVMWGVHTGCMPPAKANSPFCMP